MLAPGDVRTCAAQSRWDTDRRGRGLRPRRAQDGRVRSPLQLCAQLALPPGVLCSSENARSRRRVSFSAQEGCEEKLQAVKSGRLVTGAGRIGVSDTNLTMPSSHAIQMSSERMSSVLRIRVAPRTMARVARHDEHRQLRDYGRRAPRARLTSLLPGPRF